jgi:ABC-type transporter Mla subunit MlaD
MGQFAGTAFGIGTPTIYPGPQNPWSVSPYSGQGFGAQAISQQIAQLLQIVPQQLQQVQLLQQQQFVLLQQLLHIVPAQLQQLQQLIQVAPQQVQQFQQQQPFGAGLSPLGFGLAPQAFGGQTSHVM